MKTFKTPKGTELPLRDVKGKDYLDVPYRVQWMREEHLDWGIETEFLTLSSEVAIAHATIKDANGKILAQGTKSETPAGFADFIEKAETGAVGRALALCGYGTQFAQELCEEERIVDSPKEPKKGFYPAVVPPESSDVGAYVVNCAPYKGMRLDAIDIYALNSWVGKWEGKTVSGVLADALKNANIFLKSREAKKA